MDKKEIEQPDEQLGFLLMQTSLLKQRIVNAALRELDITYVQFVILAAVLELASAPKPVTQQAVVLRRNLDKAMVSNVVKSLVQKKMVQRRTHPADNRAFVPQLTPLGKTMALRGKEIAIRVDLDFFKGGDQVSLNRTLKVLLTENGEGYEKT